MLPPVVPEGRASMAPKAADSPALLPGVSSYFRNIQQDGKK